MKTYLYGLLATLAGLGLPAHAWSQSPTTPVTMADASIVVTEETVDSIGSLRLSAQLLDPSTGETLETAEVSGDREDVYGLFVMMATQLMGDVSDDPAAEAQALFALGQFFEAQGNKDLAADAYQNALEVAPKMKEAREAFDRLVGHWEINVYAGLLNDEPEFESAAADDAFRRDAIFGARGAYHFPFQMFLQAEVANTLVSYSASGVRQNLNGFPVLGAIGYNFIRSHDFEFFASAGGGAVFWNADDTGRETNLDLNFGMGGRLYLTRNNVLRADIRVHRVSGALSATNESLAITEADDTLWGLELSAGVSWFPAGG